jgi:hypothetical protein
MSTISSAIISAPTSFASRYSELYTRILSFKYDPVGFVMYAFPWGKTGTPLEKFDAPRQWQLVELIKIRNYEN